MTSLDTPKLVPVDPETPEHAHARAERCFREIGEVLARHRCHLAPVQNRPEFTYSEDGATVAVRLSATYGVIPDPMEATDAQGQ